MFKVNNKDIGTFIVNFEHISHLALVFLLLTLSREMPAGNMQTKIFMKIGTIKYDVGYRYKNVWQNRKFLFGIIYLLCTQDFPHK